MECIIKTNSPWHSAAPTGKLFQPSIGPIYQHMSASNTVVLHYVDNDDYDDDLIWL